MLKLFAIVGVIVGLATGGAAQTDLRNYVFGNSLIHHVSDTDETTVPHWVAYFARNAGNTYRASGQWGFLRNFSKELPPTSTWSFKDVLPAWDAERKPFGQAGIDVVMMNPANFIQYQSPARPYDGDNPTQISPLAASLALLDGVLAQGGPSRFAVYEGWSDLALISQYPPSRRKLRKYHVYNADDYHDWYVDFVDQMQRDRPEVQVDLIPVARVLARVFLETGLKDIPVTDLYVDDAPHGSPTIYFLAGAVSYAGLYGELPKAGDIPDSIHPLVKDHFAELREIIAQELVIDEHAALFDGLVTDVVPLMGAIGGSLDDPSLAMGLNGIADWSTQQPFVDVMKTARRWIGHLHGQWGGVSYAELKAAGVLDENGWPTRVPAEVDRIETFVLTEQPEEFATLAGRYRLTYQGRGKLRLTGRASVVSRDEGEIWFEYQPGEGLVGLAILETDPDQTGDYIRNIRIIPEKLIPLDEVGAVFNPDWLARIEDLRLVRFMDWMSTNNSDIVSWDERPTFDDFSYTRRGVPIELMVRLCNQIGTDAWFNMPHKANDAYVSEFASYVADTLDTHLKAYVEYSNEVWNFTFDQAHYAAAQAKVRWGTGADGNAWMQFSGVRGAEVMRIWSDVYGATAKDRIVRVAGTHTDWPGLENAMLQAPLRKGVNPTPPAPVESFDVLAITGYFGFELGSDDTAPKVLNWIAAGRARAERDGRDLGLKQVLLESYVSEHEFDTVIPKAIKTLREGSFGTYITESLPYMAKSAKENGLGLVMYEGGTHAVGLGGWTGNEDLTRFLQHLNYSDDMSVLYEELLAAWKASGAGLFNAFVDVAPPSQFGSWGTLRHLDDATSRHDVLMKFNAEVPAWWETRAAGTFTNGGLIRGSDVADVLKGTGKRDIIVAGQGDDELWPSGPDDRLHGGDGEDHAVLPGVFDDYEFMRDGRRLVARSKAGKVTLYAIETLSFANDPDFILPVDGFF